MIQTKRIYHDKETGTPYNLFTSQDNSKFHLIDKEGREVKNFYISFTSGGAEIKLNNKKIICVNSGEFYQLKEGERVTHRKFIGFSKFSKI